MNKYTVSCYALGICASAMRFMVKILTQLMLKLSMKPDDFFDVILLFITLFVVIGMFMGFVSMINWMLS